MSPEAVPAAVASAVAYLLLVTAIGVWAARRTRTPKDFFIAGQGIGPVVTALATTAAAFSGFVFVGGPGLAYSIGAGSAMICLSLSFTSAMLCWTLAKRLRLLAAVREIYTVPDAFAARFRHRGVTGLAAVAVLVGTVGYLGAQLLALSVLFETVFDTREAMGAWSAPLATALGLAVVLFYATAGGMVAGVYTDLVQGVLMAVAAVAVARYALAVGGGLAAISQTIVESPTLGSGFLDPLGGAVPAVGALGFFFVFSIGVLGQPHMLHKLYMLDDPRKLKWMPLAIAGSQSLCILIWLAVGLAVPALVASGAMPALAAPDDATPAFLLAFAPPLLTGVVLAAALAAIMSTADSFLNIGAAALVRDLPRALGRPLADELAWGRRAVVALGLAAAVTAFLYDDLVALLGTLAFGTFAASLAPALAIGLNWRRVDARAAGVSMAVGLVLNLGLEVGRGRGWIELPAGALPSAVALAASFVVLVVMSCVSGGEDEVDGDVAVVMEV